MYAITQLHEPTAGASIPAVRTSLPRCADGNGTLTPLFFSDDLIDIARAKAICAKCALGRRLPERGDRAPGALGRVGRSADRQRPHRHRQAAVRSAAEAPAARARDRRARPGGRRRVRRAESPVAGLHRLDNRRRRVPPPAGEPVNGSGAAAPRTPARRDPSVASRVVAPPARSRLRAQIGLLLAAVVVSAIGAVVWSRTVADDCARRGDRARRAGRVRPQRRHQPAVRRPAAARRRAAGRRRRRRRAAAVGRPADGGQPVVLDVPPVRPRAGRLRRGARRGRRPGAVRGRQPARFGRRDGALRRRARRHLRAAA